MTRKRITYPVNEKGIPIGGAHHRAKLSDEQVDHMRDLYEEGIVGYRTLARYFGVSKELVAKICKYERRVATPAAWKSRVVDADVMPWIEGDVRITTRIEISVLNGEDLV